MSEKIHRGKIKTPPDPLVVKYLIEPGIQNDIKYRYQAFLDCNKAHVLMLAKQGIVTRETAAAILRCNDKMAQMATSLISRWIRAVKTSTSTLKRI